MATATVVLLCCVSSVESFMASRGSASMLQWRKSLYSTEPEPKTAVLDAVAPVPKVPSSAWKWPPVWPFPVDLMEVVTDEAKSKSFSFSLSQLDVFRKHLAYFVTPGMSVLEIGAQAESMMSKNVQVKVDYLALTGSAFSREISSVHALKMDGTDALMPFAKNAYDVIVVTSGIESLSEPRDVFREIWRVLKPGGRCIVCFSGKPNIPELQPVKMWTTMTEEQKIWIVGSYYQYSAGEGWENIEGYVSLLTDCGTTRHLTITFPAHAFPLSLGDSYDLLGASGTLVFDNKADSESCYAVQASKFTPPSIETAESTDKFFATLMPALKHMGADDKKYNAMRMAADYSRASSSSEKQRIIQGVERLSSIYAILKEVKDTVIPAPIKALLANYLVAKWENTPAQVAALRKGLGLDAGDAYWTALSAQTGMLPPKKKIFLLAEMIPRFGVDPRVEAVPEVMQSVFDVLRKRFPAAEEKVLQAYTSELVLSDYLNTGSSLDRLTRWCLQAPEDALRKETV